MTERQRPIVITESDLREPTLEDLASQITLNPASIDDQIKILEEHPIDTSSPSREPTNTGPASGRLTISRDDILTQVGLPRRRVPTPSLVSLGRELDSNVRVSIKDIPINWSYLQTNAHVIGRLIGKPDLLQVISRPEVPAGWSSFIPMLASTIAHARDRRIPLRKPTFEEAARIKPAVGIARKLLGESELGERFESYTVSKAEARIDNAGERIVHLAEAASRIENPRRRFHEEMDKLYKYATGEHVLPRDQALGPNTPDADIRLEYLLGHLVNSQNIESIPHDIREQFGLTSLVRDLGLVPEYSYPGTAIRIAAPEILSGIYNFLHSNGPEGYYPPNGNTTHPMFSGEWAYFKRQLAERFKHKDLSRAERKTSDVLMHIYNILPENGPQFASSIHGIAEGICRSKEDGVDDDTIARNLLQI